MNENRRFPNLFWPVLFVGVGSLLLLSNLEIIEAIDYNILWRLWPVFLVIIGINLLFGRQNRMLVSLFSGVLALGIVGFLYFSPKIVEGLPTPQLVTESFDSPLDGVESADINLDFDHGNLTVNALQGGGNLFEAVVNHDEKVTFRTSGTSHQTIRLTMNNVGGPQIVNLLPEPPVSGEIGLATGIPLGLKMEIGSGNANLNLTELELSKIVANSGSGSIKVYLPTGDFAADLGSGSGSLTIETGRNSQLDLKAGVGSGRVSITIAAGNYGQVDLESGSGGLTVVVPEGTAVQLRGETGSGSVNLPGEFVRVAGSDGMSGDSGTWQTPGFAEAKDQLYIQFSVGSGSLRVQYP